MFPGSANDLFRRDFATHHGFGEGRPTTRSRPFAAVVAKGSFGSRRTECSADASGQPLQPEKPRAVRRNVCRVGISVTRFQINRDRNRLS